MVSLSVAWVIVTIVNQRDLKEFTFNPGIFVLTGVIDCVMVLAAATAFPDC